MASRGISPDAGFTVIEALVAMTVLAISAVALIGVSESQVARIDGLETRAIATWVAENRLTELELSGPPAGDGSETATMLGRDWDVMLSFRATADPELSEVSISVVEAGTDGPASVLVGFLDARPSRP